MNCIFLSYENVLAFYTLLLNHNVENKEDLVPQWKRKESERERERGGTEITKEIE